MSAASAVAAQSLASGEHSAPVTHVGQRIIWTVVTLLVLAGIYLLMWRGWRKRQARQSDLQPLNDIPEGAFPVGEGGFEAVYVSTTSEGDWLDRIAVHGLGERSNAQLHVAEAGILIDREPTAVFIPADAVRGVRLASGMAGKYLRGEGLVVITWQHGDRTLDTGVDPRHGTDELMRALESRLAVSATERPSA